MQGTVGFDYELATGGPSGKRKVIATFRKDEKLTLVRVSVDGEFPSMYTITEYPQVGKVSWRILLGFVRDFT